jgi:thioredoxin 1
MAAALSLLAAAAIGFPASATSSAAPQKAQQRAQLVFFMNPNGAPCQQQDRILQDMSGELRGKVEVVYYKTTTPADIARFQQYGIRALPTLMLVDASGKEIRRATPGIQSAAQVRQLVGG